MNVFLTDIQFLDDFETRRRKINGISNKMNEDRSFLSFLKKSYFNQKIIDSKGDIGNKFLFNIIQ
ncbi:MAG: hypothetical protein DBY05_09580 [Clostridiales bacterium]|nr:MAG: hypothetical protein DBY05_09580 [Clostridiales bacterium]